MDTCTYRGRSLSAGSKNNSMYSKSNHQQTLVIVTAVFHKISYTTITDYFPRCVMGVGVRTCGDSRWPPAAQQCSWCWEGVISGGLEKDNQSINRCYDLECLCILAVLKSHWQHNTIHCEANLLTKVLVYILIQVTHMYSIFTLRYVRN